MYTYKIYVNIYIHITCISSSVIINVAARGPSLSKEKVNQDATFRCLMPAHTYRLNVCNCVYK